MQKLIAWAAGALLVCSSAWAAPVLFQGIDPNAEASNPHPVSNAAASSMDTAAGLLGPIQRIDFESLSTGNFTTRSIAAGVTASLSGTDSTLGGIVNNGYASVHVGYNTTPGGQRFTGFVPQFNSAQATLTFTFATPIQAFGAFITDLEQGTAGDLTINFNDGSAQSFPVIGHPTQGFCCNFFGFTDAGASIASVQFRLSNTTSTRDISGVDDVRFVYVPEPAGVAMMLLPLLGTALIARRR